MRLLCKLVLQLATGRRLNSSERPQPWSEIIDERGDDRRQPRGQVALESRLPAKSADRLELITTARS